MDRQQRRLQQRVALTRGLRAFFWDRDFSEVDTYLLTRSPAPEAGIEPVPAAVRAPRRQQRYLQTSCELAMKRLLAAGWARIFQLAPAFRDGEMGPLHRPEFRLLEWYRRGACWTDIVRDCEALLASLAPARLAGPRGELAMRPPYPRMSMDDLFVRHLGFSILAAPSRRALAACLRAADVHHAPSDSWDDMFHRAFLARIQPVLDAAGQPIFVTHFPSPTASLAALCPEDPRAALRFELFVGGVELANGFQELASGAEQAARFARQRRQRRRQGLAAPPVDQAFLACLDRMGPAAGVALGLERLLLLLVGGSDIDDVSFVPWGAC